MNIVMYFFYDLNNGYWNEKKIKFLVGYNVKIVIEN